MIFPHNESQVARDRQKYAATKLAQSGFLIERRILESEIPETCPIHDTAIDVELFGSRTRRNKKSKVLISCWSCIQEAVEHVRKYMNEFDELNGIGHRSENRGVTIDGVRYVRTAGK